MTKRFSSQLVSDNTKTESQPSNGKAIAKDPFQAEINSQGTQYSFTSLLNNQELERQVERAESPQTRPVKQQGLRAKVIAMAIAVGMLPVLAVGTATCYFGARAISDQVNQSRRTGTRDVEEASLMQQRQLQLLAALLIGTGATALLSGAVAAFWINRAIRSAMARAATVTAEKAGQDRAVRTKLFTDAVYEIRANLNQTDILKAAVEETRKAIATDRVLVYSLDEKSQGTVIAESVAPGWPRALGITIKDPCFGARYAAKYENGRVHAIDNIYEANLTPCYLEQLQPLAVRANLVAPLLNEKKLIGLLIAHHCSEAHVWQQFEIDLFAQIATQVSFALDNAKLLAERASLQKQVEAETQWKEYFTDATRHIHAELSEEDVLKAAVEEARRVLSADRVLVYSVDRKSQGVVVAESVAPGWPRALGRTIEDPCFEARYIKKYQDGRVRALNNIHEAGMTQCYIDQLETLDVKANLVAPILHEGKLLGLLVAHQCSSTRDWQPVEIRWFTQIATQVGFAFDNVKLIRRVEQMGKEAEAVAYERSQEKAAWQQQISALLKDSDAAFEVFSKQASYQAEVGTNAIALIQEIADSARGMTVGGQKAELYLQQATAAVQAGHEAVNLTIDNIAAFQEAVADTTVKIEHLDQTAEKISQFLSLIKDLVAQMNRQVINATIEAGRNGDVFQQSIVFIAEVVRSLTQQLTKATAEIEPFVADFETESHLLAHTIKNGTEQVSAGLELTKETRAKLNQIATINSKVNSLVSSMLESAAYQAQTSNSTSQTILEVANLAHCTSEQSAAVVESLTKLAAISQQL